MYASHEERETEMKVETAAVRRTVAEDRWRWIWFVLALGLVATASGKWTVGAAAWLAPILLVRVMRVHRTLPGYLLALALLLFGGFVGWRGVVPGVGTGWLFLGIAAAMAVVDSLPFLVDRILYPRLRGAAATLILPTAYVSLHFVLAFFGPSTGLVGYSLYGTDALVQLASLTGIWGLSFLVLWTASGVNQLWEEGLPLRSLRRPGLLPLTLALLALLWGGARLALAPVEAETVRVAMVAQPTSLGEDDPWMDREMEQRYWMGATLDDANWERMGEGGRLIQDRLLEVTAREARSGARMVFWAEGNGLVRTVDKAAFLARGGEVAREYGIYLGMALLVLPRDLSEGFLHKVVLLAPDGTVAARYRKARPVPGPEAWHMTPGDGEMAVVETPHGRIGIVICYDLDHVRDARQAGERGVDILVQPSLTWPAIARIHSEMATFRAVEHGASLVRPTLAGITLATDPRGRILAHAADRHLGGGAVTAEVPVQGTATLYSRLGDWVGWGSLLGLGVLGVTAVRRRRPRPLGQGRTADPAEVESLTSHLA
jgi:apolipoprotein N-acyltransferase